MAITISGFTGTIANIYIPVLNSINASNGIKILALSHTIMEGFFPGSKAYRTNNPGNIGTSAIAGKTGSYPTLKAGTEAQINYLNRILKGEHKAYPKAGETTLLQYISTYAPSIENNVTLYLNNIITTFKKQGITVNANTRLKDIYAIGAVAKKETASNSSNWFKFFLFGK